MLLVAISWTYSSSPCEQSAQGEALIAHELEKHQQLCRERRETSWCQGGGPRWTAGEGGGGREGKWRERELKPWKEKNRTGEEWAQPCEWNVICAGALWEPLEACLRSTKMGDLEPSRLWVGVRWDLGWWCGWSKRMESWEGLVSVQHSHGPLMWMSTISRVYASECASCIHACECVCLFRHTRCALAAAVCQSGTSSQSLSIQVELQPEETHTLPLPAFVCHKALPVTSHALKLCHSLLGTRERIQIGKGKSVTPKVIKPAARHLSQLTHTHAHSSLDVHKHTHSHESARASNYTQIGTNQDTHTHTHTYERTYSHVCVCVNTHTETSDQRKCQCEWLMMTQLPTHMPLNKVNPTEIHFKISRTDDASSHCSSSSDKILCFYAVFPLKYKLGRLK